VHDEPVSALDVSVQAQIINLLKEIQERFNMGYVFIGHNIAVVQHMAHKIAVMYLGKVLELCDSSKILTESVHPYTKALMSAFPVPDPSYEQEEIKLGGEIPSPINRPSGCSFHPRCESVIEKCFVWNLNSGRFGIVILQRATWWASKQDLLSQCRVELY